MAFSFWRSANEKPELKLIATDKYKWHGCYLGVTTADVGCPIARAKVRKASDFASRVALTTFITGRRSEMAAAIFTKAGEQ